jgi:hypothetical protein
LCGLRHGGPGFILHKREIETHYEVDNRSNPATRVA